LEEADENSYLFFLNDISSSNGKNSIGIFPTGFGKSVCFYLLPLLFNEIKGDGHICLVISPLKPLMVDQIQKANLYNIQAIFFFYL
jgi:ATP-dependent DNA helicase RecQ